MRLCKDSWPFLLVSLVVLLLVSLPYLAADWAGGEAHYFTGLLQNPLDGNSYLAKMYQGWQGEWAFTLPYTAGPGEGTYLFLFYLFLGHLARIFGLSTVLVFHLARISSAALMLLALWRFYTATLPNPGTRGLTFAVAGMGSGLGWLAALAGGFTADFWVAEAYPFLSAYSNPHFPLGMALVLTLLAPASQKGFSSSRFRQGWALPVGLLLGIVMPFGVVVAAFVLAGSIAWEWAAGSPNGLSSGNPERALHGKSELVIQGRGARAFYAQLKEEIWCLFWLLAGGGPVLAYDSWVARTHPVLSGWNAQNLTPAPPWWDVILSFSPALWLAIAGTWVVLRVGGRGLRLLLAWSGLGLLLLYLPFDLQRRFILGLYVPLSGLAALGIEQLAGGIRRRGMVMAAGFLLLALPTNLMVLLSATHGIATHAYPLYLEHDERLAMEWIQANTPEKALFLATPETSLLIPSQTGRRVLAGHPFETVESGLMAARVATIFRGAEENESLPLLADVDYIYVGPREQSVGGNLPPGDWRPVYTNGGVTIWEVGP